MSGKRIFVTGGAGYLGTVLLADLAVRLGAHEFDCVVCHSQWTHAIFGPVVRHASLPLILWVHGPLSGRHWS